MSWSKIAWGNEWYELTASVLRKQPCGPVSSRSIRPCAAQSKVSGSWQGGSEGPVWIRSPLWERAKLDQPADLTTQPVAGCFLKINGGTVTRALAVPGKPANQLLNTKTIFPCVFPRQSTKDGWQGASNMFVFVQTKSVFTHSSYEFTQRNLESGLFTRNYYWLQGLTDTFLKKKTVHINKRSWLRWLFYVRV